MAGASGAALSGAATLGLVNFAHREKTPRKPPNVLLLIADDMRFDATGFAGNRVVRTPVLDKLAGMSAVFTRCFVTTSICAVSRASIMTGQYARRHGIHEFRTPLSEQQLRQSYVGRLRATHFNGFVGKWGIGDGAPLPVDHFDYWDGFGAQGKYFEQNSPDTPHLNKRLTESAVKFLDRSKSDSRPFCLTVSFKAPHAQDGEKPEFPFEPEYKDFYKNTTIPVPSTATEKAFLDQPEFLRTSEGRVRWERRFANIDDFQNTVKNYYRLMSGLDHAVGEILKSLDESGRMDDTLVIFTSDNGFFFGEHGFADKWWMYEESIRTPLFMRLPSRFGVAPGRIFPEMALNIDISPTILAACGMEGSPDQQGDDLTRLVMGDAEGWRSEFYYEHYFKHPGIPVNEGIRDDTWKYINWNGQPENENEMLFNLESDPFEETNLAGLEEFAEKKDEMKRRMNALREKLT